jgi:amino acid adenylation domain-containing protein
MRSSTLLNPTPPSGRSAAGTLVARFEQWAAATPAALAASCAQYRWTYAELNERANFIARRLVAAGVQPDDVIAMSVHRSAQIAAVWLGILKAGAAFAPLDPFLPAERIGTILTHLESRLFLTEAEVLRSLSAAGVTAPTATQTLLLDRAADCLVGQSPENVGREAQPSDRCYVIYTSGSTGAPKGVEVLHGGVLNAIEATASATRFDHQSTCCAVTTIGFDIAVMEHLLPLTTGGRVHVVDKEVALDPAALLKELHQQGATHLMTVPSSWRRLSDYAQQHAFPANFVGVCGGDVLPQSLADQIRDQQVDFLTVYGPTEVTIWSTIKHLTARDPQVSLGWPIAGTTLMVLDDERRPVAEGEPGEAYIGGVCLARGYLGQPELTAERFVMLAGERLYRTGDRVRKLASGEIEFLGRIDSQIKIRGFRVELEEIERALRRAAPATEWAVIARTTGEEEAQLVAFWSGAEPDLSGVRAQVAKSLPPYMLPAKYQQLAKFPLNENGKTDRGALARIAPTSETEIRNGASHAAPNDSETIVLGVFQRQLANRELGVTDNFFTHGGDSLRALEAVVELNRLCHSTLGIGELLRNPTAAKLAKVLRSQPEHDRALVVPLGNSSAEAKIFCVFGASLYQALAAELANRYQLLAVLTPQETALMQSLAEGAQPAPLPTIAALATSYTGAILESQPTSPYRIVGLSFGGIMAFEVARQLSAAGHRVELLGLFDPILPPARRRSWMRWLQRRGADLVRVLRGGDLSAANKLPASEVRAQQLQDLRDAQFAAAILDWTKSPVVYSGPVTLFRAADNAQDANFITRPDYGWANHAIGPLHVYDVPGGHLSMLQPPNVSELARQLTAVIDGAPHGL